MNNNDINNKKQNKFFLLIPYFLIILALLFIFFKRYNNLQQENKDLKQEKSVEPVKEEFNFFFKPYLTYKDKEGNTIREYNFFPGMKPTGKDHKGRLNYFSFKEFIENAKKYNFNTFPVITGEGSENIYNLEYENGQEKKEHGWRVSKANFNLILTNKPYDNPKRMTQSTSGNFDDYNGFVNASYCFLDHKTFLDFLEIAKNRPSEFEKFTHMRFVTKNLEAEFDSVYFGLNAVPDWIPGLKDDYRDFFNDKYIGYLKNSMFSEILLQQTNEINNKYASSKTYVFGINLELEEKEIFYNKTNQIEKRYVIKKDYLKRNFKYLTWALKDKINNDDFKNFEDLNKNFESRTLSDTKQPRRLFNVK
ncbi:hypothetical protein [Candidatus Phytoplasma sp. AldY-WA1]|uniref:hypothetical protein n=1 Tax=Candidatus Phytoplasma sp. AldY-WA1 TaxID=2852100 RepID=UPI00254F05EB|nr:hypothetical protein [Candidatus Phytoplasma sp. AldY-WA1]